jgi:phospholipase C
VPCIIVSPFSAPGVIDRRIYDHTSILKMIEWRWDLPALSARDEAANNLADALDFNRLHRSVPHYAVPAFTSVACPSS